MWYDFSSTKCSSNYIMVKSGSGKINPIRMDPIRTGASYPALFHQCCEIYQQNLREFATAMLNKRTSAARPSQSREICIDHPYSEKFLSTIPIPKRKKMKHRQIYPGIVHPYPKDWVSTISTLPSSWYIDFANRPSPLTPSTFGSGEQRKILL